MTASKIVPALDPDRPKFKLDAIGIWFGYVLISQVDLIISACMALGIGTFLAPRFSGALVITMLLWCGFAVLDHRKGLLRYNPKSGWDAPRHAMWERVLRS